VLRRSPRDPSAQPPRSFFLGEDGFPIPSADDRPAVLARTYYVSDREVTLGQFRRFLADPAADKEPAPPTGRFLAREWKPHRTQGMQADHPLLTLQAEHVTLFCNWLSAREGRRPCYRPFERPPFGWACDFTADGYRLPTNAEWDHAHRAGSQARFFFGDDARWLPLYGQVALDRTAPCGSKLPNRWGLFDVVGNVWDVTSEGHVLLPEEGDFLGMFPDGYRLPNVRGGGYASGSHDCLADFAPASGWGTVVASSGFRVVCGSAAPTRESLPGPEDGRPALAFLARAAGDDVALLLLRGDLHGRYGDLRAAAADYERVVKASPPSEELWSDQAPLLVQTGDRAGYRSLRRRLLDRYEKTTGPEVAERVARACLLAEVGDDLGRVLRLLETALGNGRAGFETSPSYPPWLRPRAELVRGMAEYRRGEYAAALEWLGRSRMGRLRVGCQALCGFFEAMAHHRLGQKDEAVKAFRQARSLRAKLAAAQAKRGNDGWKDVLRAAIAEAAAKELLEGRRK
jgi:formylglycine-generating enzyme required for sulfatase activity